MHVEHPLAALLGIEGLALLRAFTGEYDRAFVQARLAEIRRLLDDPALQDGVEVDEIDTVTGYDRWAPTYDDPGNGAFDIEEPAVHAVLDALPAGDALDAACGTGRHTRYLVDRGHRVIGVDSSADMLSRARARVPEATFRSGDLTALPLPDATVDLVVCALALTHQADLAAALAELTRVLRPGGHLVVSDMHREAVLRGSIPHMVIDGRPARLPAHRHLLGDYLRPALQLGLTLRSVAEPTGPAPASGGRDDPPDTDPGPWLLWPWSLAALVPAAAHAANAHVPAVLVLHLQRCEGSGH